MQCVIYHRWEQYSEEQGGGAGHKPTPAVAKGRKGRKGKRAQKEGL